jgi:transposase
MRAIFIEKNQKIYRTLKKLKKEVEKDGMHSVSRRIQAIILNMDGYSAPRIAESLHVSRCQASVWIRKYREGGVDALLEGLRSGRPPKLSFEQLNRFIAMLKAGPESCGFPQEKWTYALIQSLIEKEFKIKYHPSHVRKILHVINFSLNTQNSGKSEKRKKSKYQKEWTESLSKLRWMQKPIID